MGMIYRGLTFDGVNSLDYGIYITGDGVYNAPTRDVEMITIAGRNGEYALDNGRFNNISVTYKAGSFASTQTEFAEKISDFRNAILSKVGYKRLEDDYHPNEYRMAVYMNGLEVDPVHYSEAGEFELTFDCKPQRFLKSGEVKQTVGEWGETETASGSIASFNGESDTGIKSLLIDLDYLQSGRNTVKAYASGKNLLWNMQGNTYTTSGITFTKTADGKVIANGTATANAWYKLAEGFICKAPMILSGCPSGGSSSKYEIQLDGVSNVRDFGDGVSFNTSGSGKFYIVVRRGQTVNNLVFEPMVRLATESADYEPYQGETTTKSLGQTVYGGTLDLISGVLTSTLNADGTEKTTPEVIQLTGEQIETLIGVNNIWADSGEVSVEYGADPNVLVNPTLFASHPLLEVRGYGAINMGDESVVIHNEPVGRVNLAVTQTVLENTASTFEFSVAVNDPTVYQTGDEITFLPVTVQMKLNGSVYLAEISDKSNMGARANGRGSGFMLYLDIPTLIAESGVDGATYTGWADVTIKTSPSASPYTVRYSLSVLWDDDTNTMTYTLTLPSVSPLTYTPAQTYVGQSTARADSTKPSLGNPLYIDLDIGEAYKIEGTVIPINSAVEIPAELPTLKAGANTITYDNTITQLDITPRYWKI